EAFIKAKKEALQLKEEFPQLDIQVGAEANVISLDGDIDVPESIYRELDWLIVGLHPLVWPADARSAWYYVLGNRLHTFTEAQRQRCLEINTKALVAALRRHKVDVVAHPGLGMPVDLEEVARVCAETNTAFEINTGHRYQQVTDL